MVLFYISKIELNIFSLSLTMPPVELNSVPHKEEARRSVTDLKVVEKVMGIPAVCDTVHVVANAIRYRIKLIFFLISTSL